MRIRTSAIVLGICFGLLSVLQQGTLAQYSCSPVDCNDGNSCTDDECVSSTGLCVHQANGSCTANPKSLSYWQSLCRGNDSPVEFFTDADLNCVSGYTCTASMETVTDLCVALDISHYPGQTIYPEEPSQSCLTGMEQLAATALNVCRGRLTLTQGVETNCGGGGSFDSTVEDFFFFAGIRVCADHFPFGCDLARCVLKEMNQGRALHVTGLMVSKLSSGGVHLVWTPPLADTAAASGTPRSYRVWRAVGTGSTFVQIGEVADPAFDDTAAEGAYLRYDVTPVW